MQYKQWTSKNTPGCCTPFSLHCFTRLRVDTPPTFLFTFLHFFFNMFLHYSICAENSLNLLQLEDLLKYRTRKCSPGTSQKERTVYLYHTLPFWGWEGVTERTFQDPNFKVSWDLFAAEFQERHCFAGTSDWFGAQMAATSANRAHRCEDLRRVKRYYGHLGMAHFNVCNDRVCLAHF